MPWLPPVTTNTLLSNLIARWYHAYARGVDDASIDLLVAELAADLAGDLADHPDDADRRSVLADALQSIGDPHGELIALQGRAARTAETDARARELVAELTEAIGGDVPLALEWRHGFVDRVVVDPRVPGLVERWPAIAAHRCMRLVRAMRLDCQLAPAAIGVGAVRALLAAPPATVRELTIGTARLPPELVDELLAQLPRVTVLELIGALPTRLDALGRLTRLAVWPQSTPVPLDRLWAAPLPQLRALVIGASSFEADYAGCAPLLDGKVHTGVDQLALMGFADLIVHDLPTRAILPRLRSLGLAWDRLGAQTGEPALAAARAAFAHVALVWPKPFGAPLSGTEAYRLGALLRIRLGRAADALPLYQHACDQQPTVTDHWWALGNALGDAGRRDAQLDAYARVIELAPTHAGAWSSRGKALAALGRFDDAVASCTRAVEVAPGRAASWNQLGLLQRRLGALDAAIASFERAVGYAPSHEAGRNLFDTLLEARRPEAALAHIRTLRARAPDDALLARKQCRAHLALGDPATALAVADLAVCDPESYYTRYVRVAALRDLGRDTDAIAACAALADDTSWHRRMARVQEAVIARRPAPVGDGGGAAHDDCVECAVVAIAAAAVLGDDALLATRRAALDQLLAGKEAGYAEGRDWTILDAIASLSRLATPARVACVAESYARATGRAVRA
jgi:tetratricopeptide (TPR) repeat protein